MKKILIPLAAVFFFSLAEAQDRHWLDPSVVSFDKEPPRGDVVSHNTREDALRRDYHRSQYLQPLSEWSTEDRGDAVVFTSRYKLPFAWIDRELFLYLGKVSGSFDVVVNGTFAGYSQTGSTPSEFDLTRISREGNNDLEIIVYKNYAAQRLENSRPVAQPQITGESYILSQPRMRVRDIFVDTRTEGTSGLLELGIIMKSHQLNVKDYKVYYELLSPRGELLAEGYKDAVLDMRREDTVRFFANIPDIVPWSHEQPRLYTLFVRTQHEGRFMEYLSFRIGFRSLGFEDGLVYLNGTPLKISMRDFIPSSDMDEMRARIEALRAEGINTLKLSGAPPSHEFYDLCDEMGVYLCNQADIDTRQSGFSRQIGGNPSNDPNWEGAYLDRVMNMYHTSKNSPSVIMFSLAEESANGYNLYESYVALKKLEKQRPVIYPDGGEWNNDRLDLDAMDRMIAPAVNDQWALVTAQDTDRGHFRIRNSCLYTPIIGEAAYRIRVGKKTVSQGTVPVRVLPESETEVNIPITNVKAGRNFTVEVEVRTERTDNKYILGEDQANGRKIFRGMIPLDDTDKVVIGGGSFVSSLSH